MSFTPIKISGLPSKFFSKPAKSVMLTSGDSCTTVIYSYACTIATLLLYSKIIPTASFFMYLLYLVGLHASYNSVFLYTFTGSLTILVCLFVCEKVFPFA